MNISKERDPWGEKSSVRSTNNKQNSADLQMKTQSVKKKISEM